MILVAAPCVRTSDRIAASVIGNESLRGARRKFWGTREWVPASPWEMVVMNVNLGCIVGQQSRGTDGREAHEEGDGGNLRTRVSGLSRAGNVRTEWTCSGTVAEKRRV